MDILQKIIETKRREVSNLKKAISEDSLRKSPFFGRTCLSLKNALLREEASGIIAEFKQKSPSKGEINYGVIVEKVTRGYAEAGATGLSVLTDYEYFGWTMANLVKAREANQEIPILRKDFIIDRYQLAEAKAGGADVILLIAACLDRESIHSLAGSAKELGLEVLLEIHDASEIEKISPLVDLIGVNNRNLKSFEVTTATSLNLAPLIPDSFVKVSESGLSSAAAINTLKEAGYRGFLIGETFMKTADPALACQTLIRELKK